MEVFFFFFLFKLEPKMEPCSLSFSLQGSKLYKVQVWFIELEGILSSSWEQRLKFLSRLSWHDIF